MSFPSTRGLSGAIVVIGIGAWMLFFQGHFAAWHKRRHEERLADRHARGEDAYFEELRALEAYPPPRLSRGQQRVVGAIAILAGLGYLALSFGSGQ